METNKLTSGDRVRHRRQGWEGTLVEDLIKGTSITGEKIHAWVVKNDDGIERACDADELVLCNKIQGQDANLLHKTIPTTPVLCNKQVSDPTNLLHKTMAEAGLLSLPQLHELQRHILHLIDSLTELEIPLKKGRELVDRVRSGSIVYQLETVRCGNPRCRSCPHGPYWYAYFRSEGKVRSKYVGKELKSVI